MIAGSVGMVILFPLKYHNWVWKHRRLDQVARLVRHRYPLFGDELLAAMMPLKAAPDRSRFLLSPMPGRVISIAVEAGQVVTAGEALCVVDAMKMENVLRAERGGRVVRVVVSAGDSVSVDQVILELE